MTQCEQVELMPEQEVVSHVGEQLKACRSAQGKTVQEAAKVLHLDLATVHALEAGDESALPEAIFVRGYIQNYARFLGIDAKPLLASYNQQAPAAPALTMRGSTRKVRASTQGEVMRFSQRRSSAMPWVIVIGLLVVAGGVSWFWPTLYPLLNEPEEARSELMVPDAMPGISANESVADQQLLDESVELEIAVMPIKEEVIVAEEVPLHTPPLVEPPPQIVSDVLDRIVISSDKDSWVAITDAQEKRLMYSMLRAGSSRELEGQAPFKVLLGYARGVELSINGEPFAVEPYIAKNSARFNLERP